MQRFILILLCLCAVGCGAKGSYAVKTETSENIRSSEYAYVLAGVNGCEVSNWSHVSKAHNEKHEPDEMLTLRAGPWCMEKYHLFAVKPGRYTMIHFYLNNGSVVFQMTHAARDRNEQIKHSSSLVGSFTADKGIVTYIGTFYQETNIRAGTYSFTVADERDEAKEFISKKYPGIDPETVVYRPALSKQ